MLQLQRILTNFLIQSLQRMKQEHNPRPIQRVHSVQHIVYMFLLSEYTGGQGWATDL
jgi:hypothetical protein